MSRPGTPFPFGYTPLGGSPLAYPPPGFAPVYRPQLGNAQFGLAPPGGYVQPPRKPVVREHNPQGIVGRIELIRGLIHESIRDADVSRKLALRITSGCGWRNDTCELQMIWDFMHRNIRYTGDIAGYDTFQSARRTLDFRGGDCDDGMTLIATLAMGNQFIVKGRITSNPGDPKQWAHIFPMVGFPKLNPTRWFTLDWTLGYSKFGAQPPQARHIDFDGKHVIESPREMGIADYQGW